MVRSLYTAISGMISLEAKQDTISSNLSNASTVGYKSGNLAFKKFEDVLIEKLIAHDVFLSNGSKFGDSGDGFMRMNLACPQSILEAALKRIQSAIQE